MVWIACLHTAESNTAVFDVALHTTGLAGVKLHHEVRADILAAAEREERLTPEIGARTAAVLRGLCVEADTVLLTCSTLGPAAEVAAVDAPVPIMRVDAAWRRRRSKAEAGLSLSAPLRRPWSRRGFCSRPQRK